MWAMFQGATSFNQPLNNWDVGNVELMNMMFSGATSFNQNIGNWNLSSVMFLAQFFNASGMDCTNYSNTLIGWKNNPLTPNNKVLGASSIKYKISAQADRNYLIGNKGWTIIGDSVTNDSCCVYQIISSITACDSYYINGSNWTSSTVFHNYIVNLNSCDTSKTIILTINSANSAVTQSGAFLTANATGATYQWLSCSPYQKIFGETNQNFTATANGQYAVVVNENFCTDTSFCYTVVGIGTNTFELSNNIKIYPNPVFHTLQVEAENEIQLTSVKLIDVTGKVLLERASSSLKKISIDMSSYSSGNYFIQITSPNFSYVKKVYKE
jgi:hypothetical protein